MSRNALDRGTLSRHVMALGRDTVTQPSTCLDTEPQPSVMTCLGKVPRPSACLDTVPRPSIMPRHGTSA